MRCSHNNRYKKKFIRFRNYIRKQLAYIREDFRTARDKDLNEIADSFNIQIIKWSPHTGEALLVIYNTKKSKILV